MKFNAEPWSHYIGSSHVHWTIFLPKNWHLKTSKQPSLITFGTLKSPLLFTHPSYSLGKPNTPKKRAPQKKKHLSFPEGSDFNLEELQGPGRWERVNFSHQISPWTKIWCFKFEGRKIRPGCESERLVGLDIVVFLRRWEWECFVFQCTADWCVRYVVIFRKHVDCACVGRGGSLVLSRDGDDDDDDDDDAYETEQLLYLNMVRLWSEMTSAEIVTVYPVKL